MITQNSFERSFQSCPPGYRLDFRRERSYDAEYGLFYSESQQETVDVQIGPRRLPSAEWVADALVRMVVGEGTGRTLDKSPPRLDRLRSGRRVDIEAYPLERYIELCEEEYVFGGLADNLIGPAETPKAQRFLKLISNRWLGNPINRKNVTESDVEPYLERAVSAEAPIQLLLPAMPFKDQCAFRTDSPADHIDLGEIAFLVRLHCLALAVNQMHKFDCECVIVSDGSVYASIFGIARRDATRYLEHLRNARDKLNLSKSVHIVDLDDLVKRDDQHRRDLGYPSHRRIRNYIRREIERAVAENASTAAALALLERSMRWNIDTRSRLTQGDLAPVDLWRWLSAPPGAQASRASQRVPDEITTRAREAAFEYAAFNLAISYTGLLARHFPNAIRLTSHAKPGQVVAPRLGSVFAWNGVAVADSLDERSVKASSIKSVELHSVRDVRLVPVYERNGKFPVCYTKEGSR